MTNQIMTAQQMNYKSADPVADYFLTSLMGQAGDYISNLKLQKLCYLAQGYHLAYHNTPIFDDMIQAWAHGPVVVSLYHRFKKYKWHPIDLNDRVTWPSEYLHDDALHILSEVWRVYGQWSAKQLENLTHKQAPWKDAYGDRQIGLACDEVITQKAIKDYFITLI